MLLADKLWAAALPVLAEEVATASYTGFIEVLSPIAIKDGHLILEAPSEFVRMTLSERYSSTVRAALKNAGGKDYSVTFITPLEREQYIQAVNEVPTISLNPKYTFDSFVIGSSNRFAHAASNAVAKNPGKSYNPLFIYGGVGLGKTHLMHAIGNEISYQSPSTRILYITSEKFTNELIAAIRNDRNEEFRARYRNVDVLMVDDIQFISNKEGTQEEFFHTFNALYDAQKQIVISSDKQPKEIPTLEERLRSRFEWGLIADIQPPDHETRVAILQKKAIIENLDVSESVLHYIASKVESNIRELEGTLTRVIAYSDLTGQPVTIESASEALKDFFPRTKKRAIDAQFISEVVSDFYGVTLGELSAKKRSREVALPRQVAMYLVRTMTDLSLPKIGDVFGGRDHTTVMHACDKIIGDMKTNAVFKITIEDLIKRIRE